MGILENTWFVGISTGIISGILVFFLTKWFVDKKGKAEYYKQVSAANISVINSLKPYISDKGLPDIEIFQALIASSARNFGVNEGDMYSVSVYCEELIREIISDVYVSNEKKQEYTQSLAAYQKKIASHKEMFLEISKEIASAGIYGEKLRSRMSVYMGVLTSFIGVMCSVLMTDFKKLSMIENSLYTFDDNPIILVMIIIVMIILMLVLLFVTAELLLKIVKRNKRNDKEQQE